MKEYISLGRSNGKTALADALVQAELDAAYACLSVRRKYMPRPLQRAYQEARSARLAATHGLTSIIESEMMAGYDRHMKRVDCIAGVARRVDR